MPPGDLQRNTPLHQQIANYYAQLISGGTLAPGQQLPSLDEITAMWAVGRSTAEKAVALLRDEGVVDTSRTGVFVRGMAPIRRRAAGRYTQAAREANGGRGAFDTELRAQGLTPRSDVDVYRTSPAPTVAGILGPDSVLARERRMYANDTPVQLATSYIPWAIAEGTALEAVDTGPGGMLSRLADLGYAQTRVTETVRVRRADPTEREFLRLAPDMPVLEILHTGYDTTGRAVEVCVHALPASGWLLDYEWIIADPA